MSRTEEIEQRLRTAFEVENLDIVDESDLHVGHEGAKGGGGHFLLTIISPAFDNKNTLQRHRMIYEALGEMMQKDIHALSINALTPTEL